MLIRNLAAVVALTLAVVFVAACAMDDDSVVEQVVVNMPGGTQVSAVKWEDALRHYPELIELTPAMFRVEQGTLFAYRDTEIRVLLTADELATYRANPQRNIPYSDCDDMCDIVAATSGLPEGTYCEGDGPSNECTCEACLF